MVFCDVTLLIVIDSCIYTCALLWKVTVSTSLYYSEGQG